MVRVAEQIDEFRKSSTYSFVRSKMPNLQFCARAMLRVTVALAALEFEREAHAQKHEDTRRSSRKDPNFTRNFRRRINDFSRWVPAAQATSTFFPPNNYWQVFFRCSLIINILADRCATINDEHNIRTLVTFPPFLSIITLYSCNE